MKMKSTKIPNYLLEISVTNTVTLGPQGVQGGSNEPPFSVGPNKPLHAMYRKTVLTTADIQPLHRHGGKVNGLRLGHLVDITNVGFLCNYWLNQGRLDKNG